MLRKKILFVRSGDGSVLCLANGGIPSVPNNAQTEKFLARLCSSSNSVQIYTMDYLDANRTLPLIVVVPRELEATATAFLKAHTPNASWRSASTMHSNLLTSSLNRVYYNPSQKSPIEQQVTESISLIQRGLDILAELDVNGQSPSTSSYSNISQTTSTSEDVESLLEYAENLMLAKSTLIKSPEVAKQIGIHSPQDVTLLKLMFKLSIQPLLFKIHAFYKERCKAERRALHNDERALLDLSVLLNNISNDSVLTLVDAAPASLWVPSDMDLLDESVRGKGFVQQGLVPILKDGGTKGPPVRRGLVTTT